MIELLPIVTDGNYAEASYLAANPDVRSAVSQGIFNSGWEHFETFGKAEGRRQTAANSDVFLDTKRRKLERVRPLLRADLAFQERQTHFDFLSDRLKSSFSITSTDAISGHPYDREIMELVTSNQLVLDCGAGYRPEYFDNVVNFEIVDYPSTDVLGVGEVLPFKDQSFDAVISNAVLEHVKYPWLCASEILRVLKPGGTLFCSVPFLQPLHGYPHHYFNMSAEGIKSLFEGGLDDIEQYVPDSTSPIWSLTWFLRSWSRGLPEEIRASFEDLRIGDLLGRPEDLLSNSFVTELREETRFEIASATVLRGRKKF